MPSYYPTPPPDADTSRHPGPASHMPLSVIAWIPLSILFAWGIYWAADFGYQRASSELVASNDPAAANEELSMMFFFDPGDEPLVLATERQAILDHLSAPPGSVGSGTIVLPQPVRMRIIEIDQDLSRVILVEGKYEGQRFWTKADRLLEATGGELQKEPAVESDGSAE